MLALQQRAKAEKDEISRADQFYRRESPSRGSEKRGQSERRGACVKNAADANPER
jgi:hypothetical protein